MKKLIYLLPLFLLLQSCEKDDSDIFGDSSKNSYTICYNVDTDKALGNYHYNIDLYIYEYNSDNECIASHLWRNVRKGDSKEFTASERAIKLVVGYTLTIYAYNEESRSSVFVKNIFYLDDYNYIEIGDYTIVSDYNPIN